MFRLWNFPYGFLPSMSWLWSTPQGLCFSEKKKHAPGFVGCLNLYFGCLDLYFGSQSSPRNLQILPKLSQGPSQSSPGFPRADPKLSRVPQILPKLSRGSQSRFFDRRLQRNHRYGIHPRIPRIPRIPTIRWHQLRLGTSLPRAPGVRMT